MDRQHGATFGQSREGCIVAFGVILSRLEPKMCLTQKNPMDYPRAGLDSVRLTTVTNILSSPLNLAVALLSVKLCNVLHVHA